MAQQRRSGSWTRSFCQSCRCHCCCRPRCSCRSCWSRRSSWPLWLWLRRRRRSKFHPPAHATPSTRSHPASSRTCHPPWRARAAPERSRRLHGPGAARSGETVRRPTGPSSSCCQASSSTRARAPCSEHRHRCRCHSIRSSSSPSRPLAVQPPAPRAPSGFSTVRLASSPAAPVRAPAHARERGRAPPSLRRALLSRPVRPSHCFRPCWCFPTSFGCRWCQPHRARCSGTRARCAAPGARRAGARRAPAACALRAPPRLPSRHQRARTQGASVPPDRRSRGSRFRLQRSAPPPSRFRLSCRRWLQPRACQRRTLRAPRPQGFRDPYHPCPARHHTHRPRPRQHPRVPRPRIHSMPPRSSLLLHCSPPRAPPQLRDVHQLLWFPPPR
mmetsp:Transcript_9446/g.38779  ORF Transcript_9446/g.38779 Transcript_9446/m.38779 type:complete len:386 (-) Transcript_9446:3691-4848(-)